MIRPNSGALLVWKNEAPLEEDMVMDDNEDSQQKPTFKRPPVERDIGRALSNQFGPYDNLKSMIKSYEGPLASARAILAATDVSSQMRDLQKSIASSALGLSAFQNQLHDQRKALGQFDNLGKTLSNVGREWSDIVQNIGSIRTDFGTLSRALADQSRMPHFTAISESLREITNLGSTLKSGIIRSEFEDYLSTISKNFRKNYAEIGNVGKSLQAAINELKRVQLDWSAIANKSLTTALAASLLTTAPAGQLSKSVLELSAFTAVAMDAKPGHALWGQIRDANLIIDNLLLLREIELPRASDEADNVSPLEGLEERIVTAVAEATRPSQQLAVIQTIVAILTMFLAFAPMVQTATYHNEDAAKPDLSPVVVEQLQQQTNLLRGIFEKLEEQTATVQKIVVLRNANLRQAPTTSSRKLRTLKAGDMAVFVDSAEGWTRVEIADPLTKEVVVGWVYSRLTSKVD